MAFTRRNFLTTSSAAIAAGTLGRFAWPEFALLAQGQQQGATINMTELRRNVFIITGQGGTIGGLVNPAGAVAVDSQFPATAPLAVEELLKRSGKTQIAMLINTHHHGDHTGGNGVFRPKTAKIVAHANVPGYMRGAYDDTMKQRAAANPPPSTPAPAEPAVPDTTFTDRWSETFGDEHVRCTHYGPAHTGGDIVIYFEKANVAHMGDLMFNRMHPVIDRPRGASIRNWASMLRKVAGEYPADTIYIFGHAGQGRQVTGPKADLLRHAEYLDALLAFAADRIKAGMTRDQFLAIREVIPGFDDYGPLGPRPLPAAFDEVTASK
jgi:cyclase